MATVTARATFVIYKDEPSTASKTATADSHPAPTPSASITTSVTIVTAGDKENLHPVTGRRPATDDALGKKRKTSALATKLLIASGKSTPHPSTMKKRRLASAPPSNVPSEAREKRTTGAQKQKPSSVRRAHTIPELPKVEEEEVETEEPEHHVEAEDGDDDVTQASVDAKCYALTVSPLADVSKAYEDSPAMSERALPDEECSDTTHDEEAEADSPETAEQAQSAGSDSEQTTTSNAMMFSTPDRKRIHAAFTFSTPSPSSTRFAGAGAVGSERFHDLNFDPLVDDGL